MFGVETNARANARKVEQELLDLKVSPESARRIAAKREAREIATGNAWVKANVGLN